MKGHEVRAGFALLNAGGHFAEKVGRDVGGAVEDFPFYAGRQSTHGVQRTVDIGVSAENPDNVRPRAVALAEKAPVAASVGLIHETNSVVAIPSRDQTGIDAFRLR